MIIIQILLLLLTVAWWFAIAHIVMSWLISFGVLNVHQPIVAQIWNSLNQLLDPIYGRIRRFLPDTGALDLAPLAFILGIIISRMILVEIGSSLAF